MRKAGKIDFECPVCGGDKYKEEIVNPSGRLGMPGKYTEVPYCFCEDCSVIFRDPEKFSVKK